MDARRSRHYLDAMGVTVWRLRDAGPQASGEEGVFQSEAPVEFSEDSVAGMDWVALERRVASCRACALCDTRNKTVFGGGDRRAHLMVVGEAPGADEDRQGEPFVGRAGQLLDRMLAAIGLPRDQVFIANILKCRPPGNRDPRPEEALRCEPFLLRQIELVDRKIVV